MIKVRFAPSPTGYLHIGGARTALFNWIYAKAQQGVFVLRIEDTDLERSKKEFVDEILDSMKWLGFTWDELYFQSERFPIYKEYAQKLLDEQKAYKDGAAVILKIPSQEVVIHDLIRGEIKFDTETIKDQVLMKSDGSPTYSFACVVDDALMEISHVIRGEDHISNTPKQIVIFQALGLKPPKYAHLPLIMGDDGGRLSKRTGAVAVSEYRGMGFLPEGIVNYLMLLGWSPGPQEIVKLSDAVSKFSIKKVNKTAAIFSMDKLKWVNTQHIKQKSVEELMALLIPLLKEADFNYEEKTDEELKNIVKLYHGRINTLRDFLDWTAFIFKEDVPMDEEAVKAVSPRVAEKFHALAGVLSKIEPFAPSAIEEQFRSFVEQEGLSASELVHPVRAVLTGKIVGPGLFETMSVLGKEKTVKKLLKAKNLS